MKYNTKVIISRGPAEKSELWQFWDCGTVQGNPIHDWYVLLSEGAQDKFKLLLKTNAKVDISRNWLGFKFMQGAMKAQKIWQLSFAEDDVQHRVLGVFGKGKKAILVMGCIHKEDVYTPRNALQTAINRAKSFRTGTMGVKLYERKIATDL